MEARRERVKEHHHGQYLYLMGFLLKYQRQYSDYLGKQYHERKRKMTDRQLQALKQEYKENMKQCNFGLVGSAVQVKSVFQVVQMMRTHSESKVHRRMCLIVRGFFISSLLTKFLFFFCMLVDRSGRWSVDPWIVSKKL